ncbi:hypothetical protein BYT27DRAFT_7188931 [Phlegmacium glaucopus]|nr:hypothetical protein BYT27DRAFT_7188931 [Phlegmacium glaucopus]
MFDRAAPFRSSDIWVIIVSYNALLTGYFQMCEGSLMDYCHSGWNSGRISPVCSVEIIYT